MLAMVIFIRVIPTLLLTPKSERERGRRWWRRWSRSNNRSIHRRSYLKTEVKRLHSLWTLQPSIEKVTLWWILEQVPTLCKMNKHMWVHVKKHAAIVEWPASSKLNVWMFGVKAYDQDNTFVNNVVVWMLSSHMKWEQSITTTTT